MVWNFYHYTIDMDFTFCRLHFTRKTWNTFWKLTINFVLQLAKASNKHQSNKNIGLRWMSFEYGNVSFNWNCCCMWLSIIPEHTGVTRSMDAILFILCSTTEFDKNKFHIKTDQNKREKVAYLIDSKPCRLQITARYINACIHLIGVHYRQTNFLFKWNFNINARMFTKFCYCKLNILSLAEMKVNNLCDLTDLMAVQCTILIIF